MNADYQGAHLRESRRQQHVCACLCLWCGILSVAVFMLCITIGIRYSGNRDFLQYPSTVGDTRLISYNSFLCGGAELTTSPTGFPTTSMYFLDEQPPLNAWNILRLSGNLVISPAYIPDYDFYGYDYDGIIVYASWQFHLNPNSVINARSCVAQNTGGANFIVIQGSSNYDRWIFNPNNLYYAYEAALQPCGSGNTVTYGFTIQEEGYYYVVYYATSGTPQIFLGLTLNRTEYSTTGFSGMPNCTIGSGTSCTTSSQSSSKYVLFDTRPQNNANITSVQSFNLQWTCDSRDGSYVFIFFFPLIVLALSFCGCFGLYCLCAYCVGRSRYSELEEGHTHIHTKPVSSEKPPPPPYSEKPY